MFGFNLILICDPVGIQSQDLQNRNLTLYSAKLRDLIHFADAKVIIFYQDSKDDKPKSKIMNLRIAFILQIHQAFLPHSNIMFHRVVYHTCLWFHLHIG